MTYHPCQPGYYCQAALASLFVAFRSLQLYCIVKSSVRIRWPGVRPQAVAYQSTGEMETGKTHESRVGRRLNGRLRRRGANGPAPHNHAPPPSVLPFSGPEL
jgi:hypothetical protein